MPGKTRLTTKANHLSLSEIRKHYFLNRYVIMASNRHGRPFSFSKSQDEHKTEILCGKTPGRCSPELEKERPIFQVKDQKGKWQVKVIKNAFPALSLDNPRAYGKHEIIIETPEHNLEFSELPLAQIERVFEAYCHRLVYLKKLEGIRYVMIFKNDGPRAGASIAHAHSQVMALPLVPPNVEAETWGIESYLNQHGTCPYCDIVSWETREKVRVIYQDQYATAIAPYASTAPFGVWLIPKKHVVSFTDMSQEQKHSFAIILKKIARALDSVKVSFNFFLQESLVGHDHHFLIKVEPRANVWGGLELSTGIVINSVAPEYAAVWYRERTE